MYGSRNPRRCVERYKGWGVLVTIGAVIPPSSAASERVFSIMKDFFGNKFNKALYDKRDVSVKLSFNNTKRKMERLFREKMRLQHMT